jgi:hypothetical protein
LLQFKQKRCEGATSGGFWALNVNGEDGLTQEEPADGGHDDEDEQTHGSTSGVALECDLELTNIDTGSIGCSATVGSTNKGGCVSRKW